MNGTRSNNKSHVIYKILKRILLREKYAEAFMDIYNTFLNDSTMPKDVLSRLLIKFIERKNYAVSDFLISLGADINYQFNPNYTLPTYLNYESLEYLNIHGYDFKTEDIYGYNSLDQAVYAFISDRTCPSHLYFGYIEDLLKYMSWDRFHIRVVSGCEYGDFAHDNGHYNNHYWRRRRIDKLIELGMPYDLDVVIIPSLQKKLRNTRLGYYLMFRNVYES